MIRVALVAGLCLVATDAFASSTHPQFPWCGWWLRGHLGVSDQSYNVARNWAHYGRHADGPAIGTIVVWPHHVGIITGGSHGAWVVKSGNDGHRVRERVRSVSAAIAFRWPA